jgi:CBS domain-containing membrane protein
MVTKNQLNEKSQPAGFNVRAWLHYFGQDQAQVAWPERIRATIGAFIGLICTVALGKFVGEWVGVNEWLMASLGASALLIFVTPSSPMAQPWAVIAGNVLSALVGISCSLLIPNPYIAIPVAASSAIMGMFLLRCLHPPAAAVALIAVLGHITSYRYALFPVMIDSVTLCLLAVIYNSATGKRYPTRPAPIVIESAQEKRSREEIEKNLDVLLAEYQEVVDIDRAELIHIIQRAKSSPAYKP